MGIHQIKSHAPLCECVCVCMREREREREREEGSKSCTGICEILWYMNNTW